MYSFLCCQPSFIPHCFKEDIFTDPLPCRKKRIIGLEHSACAPYFFLSHHMFLFAIWSGTQLSHSILCTHQAHWKEIKLLLINPFLTMVWTVPIFSVLNPFCLSLSLDASCVIFSMHHSIDVSHATALLDNMYSTSASTMNQCKDVWSESASV